MPKVQNSKTLPINIVGGSTFGRYNRISSERTYNMMISVSEKEKWLVNFAGYQRAIQLQATGEGRGIFRSVRGNLMIAVVNSTVYRINPDLTFIPVGTLATSTGEVTIDENLSSQIAICDGLNVYIYNWSGAPFITIQNLLGQVPSYVSFHNSFFNIGSTITSPNPQAWTSWSFLSATTIQLTSTQAIQTKPDVALAVLRIPAQAANVLVIGQVVCEVYTGVGGTQNYRRVNTINVDYGCVSASTIDSSDSYIAWLAVNEKDVPVIMVYSGQGAAPISTDGIDNLMDTIQYPADSTAAFRKVDGHLIYQITFYNAADNLTLAYDFSTSLFYNLTDQSMNYHPARNFAYFNNMNYFVSINNGTIYQESTNITVYNENLPGAPSNPALINIIPRIRVTENIEFDDTDRFRINRLVIPIEQGNEANFTALSINPLNIITEDPFNPADDGIITEYASGSIPIVNEQAGAGGPGNPYVIPYQARVDLSISIDGATSWSNIVSRGLRPIGNRKNILTWNRLGAANIVTFRLNFYSMFRVVVNNGLIEVY
jgi:hypothetical protein